MSIEDFKGLMDNFEPASLLPEIDPIISKFAPAARILVLVGPVVLIVMGLLYFFAMPKEANYHLGYRCYYGMGSVEAWRFTQRLAGMVFGALGLVLLVAMLVISNSFAKLETMDLLWRTVYCVASEAAAAALASLTVTGVVTVRFDARGDLRKKKVKK